MEKNDVVSTPKSTVESPSTEVVTPSVTTITPPATLEPSEVKRPVRKRVRIVPVNQDDEASLAQPNLMPAPTSPPEEEPKAKSSPNKAESLLPKEESAKQSARMTVINPKERNQNNHHQNYTNGKNNNNKNNNQRRQNNRNNNNGANQRLPKIDVSTINPPPADPNAPQISINDLTSLSVPQLREKAESFGLEHESLLYLKKQDVILQILKAHTSTGGVIFAYGSLEILQDGYGFLRSPQNSYLAGSDDIYISPHQIRAFNLKTGDTVYGQIRTPKEGERFFAMQRVETVNLDTLEVSQNRVPFENLTPLFPDVRLNMETGAGDVSTRVINLFCPIGKGQRGLIVAPPRTGKTVLMQKIANAITENHPECYLIVLLIDERPEEVTDMKRSVKGEVIASTFDEQASRHVQVAEMVLEKSKRMVEQGHDVIILLDSITRLARAYNQTIPTSGKILSGGVDSNALHRPKRFFGAARNIEGGGSLTIVATALVDTGSKMDTVIFEEFKGTGNMEVTLDRRLSDKRVFPAINIKSSGTRKEEMLLTSEEVNKVWVLRKALSSMDDIQMTELILEKMRKFKTNDAFLRSMNETSDAGRN
ncbi:transcription termination factor Rho [Entomospira culicis]|nr:transcription termination factor Rho [Entomospira culicis]WDI36851.1 transcription termination factor Rho [Entomospira culicis]WDI38480.1 transcription termination factor Rho [Entomospira culicis]